MNGLAALFLIGLALYASRGTAAAATLPAAGFQSWQNTPTTAPDPAITAPVASGRMSVQDVYNLATNISLQTNVQGDPVMATAISIVESGDVNNLGAGVMTCDTRKEPQIGDASTGMMQTLLGTAQQMYDMGFTDFGKPTAQSLCDPSTSIYFGLAYLGWLTSYRGQIRSDNWIVQSYNSGPGNSSPDYLLKYHTAAYNMQQENLP